MTSFSIDGYRIAYTLAGSKSNQPIIFVHGLMSHRGVWSGTIERLKDRFLCVSYDQLGFGDSDKPKDGDYSIQKQAERVLLVADHFGVDKFILAGHSMGGQISAYLTALLAPQRVNKLIFVDGVVTGELSHRAQTLNRSLVVVGEKIPAIYNLSRWLFDTSKPFACWGFRIWFHKPEELPFASWKLDRHMAINPEIAESALKAWNSLNATNLTLVLKNIVAPTLVIFGNQDGTVPVGQAYLFKDKCAAAQLVVFDNCGHFPMYEKFDPYIAAVENFLKA
jgi:pimeloyl-ACP methyl ester carboxylesterase